MIIICDAAAWRPLLREGGVRGGSEKKLLATNQMFSKSQS